MLLVGVLCVQGLMDKLIPSLGSFSDPTAASRSGSGSAHGSSHGSHKRGGSNRKVLEPAYGRRLLEEVVGRQLSSAGPVAAQLPMLGIGAMLLAAVCSSFASVYFEKVRANPSPSPNPHPHPHPHPHPNPDPIPNPNPNPPSSRCSREEGRPPSGCATCSSQHTRRSSPSRRSSARLTRSRGSR